MKSVKATNGGCQWGLREVPVVDTISARQHIRISVGISAASEEVQRLDRKGNQLTNIDDHRGNG